MAEPATEAAKGITPSASLSPASDRLRATINWLVGSLGVVAVAVIGGISLASLGDVAPSTDPTAFGVAMTGAALAVTAALGALITAASITARSTVTVSDLTRVPVRGWKAKLRFDLAGQPVTAAWRERNYAAASAMVLEYLDSVRDYDTKYLATLSPHSDRATAVDDLERAKARLEYLQDHFTQLMIAASYLRLRSAFRSAVGMIAGFVVIVIVGALMFSYAIATLRNVAAPTELTAAEWSVPDPIRSIVASRLGDACGYELEAVPVMIVEVGDGDARRIITVESAQCASLELSTTADRLVEE